MPSIESVPLEVSYKNSTVFGGRGAECRLRLAPQARVARPRIEKIVTFPRKAADHKIHRGRVVVPKENGTDA